MLSGFVLSLFLAARPPGPSPGTDGLYTAIVHGDTAHVVRYLNDGGNPNALIGPPDPQKRSDPWRGTPLLIAVLGRRDEIAGRFLSAGASVESVESILNSALLPILIQQGMPDSLQQVLLSKPARVDPAAFVAAAQFGRLDFVETLLTHSEANHLDVAEELQSALGVACAYGHEDIARFLIPRSPDPGNQEVLLAAASGANAGLVVELLDLNDATSGAFLDSALQAAVRRLERDHRSDDARQIANLLVDRGADACRFADRADALSTVTVHSLRAAAPHCNWDRE